MTTKKTEGLSEDQLAVLNAAYPVADEEPRLTLPRLGMLAKDIVEETGKGKDKKIDIIQAAGTFFTERDLGEVSEAGKKVWTKEFIDAESIEVIIAYHRRQLRKYDSSLEKFISTPIFDSAEQVVPLYLDGQVIKRGTQAQLQSMYPALTQKGKPTSDLKEECILYVIYEGELFQMNISQSSKWEFRSYARRINPSTVITRIEPKEDEFGSNVFMKMKFDTVRQINPAEFEEVVSNQATVKDEADRSAGFFLASGAQHQQDAEAEEEYENIGKR